MSEAIRVALCFALCALAIGAALGALRRIRRIHRQYSDPAHIARLLAEERVREARAEPDA